MTSSIRSSRNSQITGSRQSLAKSISSASINRNVESNESVLLHSLPPLLAAPSGWRSEIIESNATIPNDTSFNLASTNTNISADFNEYNTYSTSIPPTTFNNNFESINESAAINSVQRKQSYLTDQQQNLIINNVEHQQPPPLLLRKTLPNNVVTYKQNISVKYLQPPPLPPPGPLIIREVRPPPPPAQPPIKIQQRPPAPTTPPPVVLRERPPPIPASIPAKVVEKVLPPPPAQPRRTIVEHYAPPPPKPADLIIERWLPYERKNERRILIERAPPAPSPQREPNLLIVYDAPRAVIQKEFINQGVVRADPESYLAQYGQEFHNWHTKSDVIEEASRAIPPPISALHEQDYDNTHLRESYRSRSPYVSDSWEKTRVISPIPRSSSYHYNYSDYYPSYDYYSRPAHRYGYRSYRSYADDYPSHYGSYLTMEDVTSSWKSRCRSSSYSYPTVRFGSDLELEHVLSDLRYGHVPSKYYSY